MFGNSIKIGGGYFGVFSAVALLIAKAFGVQLPPETEQIIALLVGGAAVGGAKVLRDANPK